MLERSLATFVTPKQHGSQSKPADMQQQPRSFMEWKLGIGGTDPVHKNPNLMSDIVMAMTGRKYDVFANDEHKIARLRGYALAASPPSEIHRLATERAERLGIKWESGVIPANAGPAAGAAAAGAAAAGAPAPGAPAAGPPAAGPGAAGLADAGLADTGPAAAALGPPEATKQGCFFVF
jgi:hypothetical protein